MRFENAVFEARIFCANYLQHVEREAIYSAVVHIDWARDVEVPALNDVSE